MGCADINHNVCSAFQFHSMSKLSCITDEVLSKLRGSQISSISFIVKNLWFCKLDNTGICAFTIKALFNRAPAGNGLGQSQFGILKISCDCLFIKLFKNQITEYKKNMEITLNCRRLSLLNKKVKRDLKSELVSDGSHMDWWVLEPQLWP